MSVVQNKRFDDCDRFLNLFVAPRPPSSSSHHNRSSDHLTLLTLPLDQLTTFSHPYNPYPTPTERTPFHDLHPATIFRVMAAAVYI